MLVATTTMAEAANSAKNIAKQCGPGIGTKVSPVQVGSLLAKLSTFKFERDEFETSNAYETRLEAFASKLPKEWMVAIPYDDAR